MPTPQTKITIGTKSSSLSSGDYVTFRNITRGGKRRVNCSSDGEAVINDPPSAWVNGDEIIIEVFGRFNSATKKTAAEGKAIHSFGTLSADTSTANVNL